MGVTGIFITIELEGALAARLHAIQLRHDPKLAREFPPHVTIIGSSGAGPIDPSTPVPELRAAVEKVTALTEPIPVRFGPPMRFIGREIVVLPLDVHGPLRVLHEALKESLKEAGVRYEATKWPFTPHCTLNMYATLTDQSLRTLLTVRETEGWEVGTLKTYLTREGVPARLLFQSRLGNNG
jgi:2'-5' RNA ligase